MTEDFHSYISLGGGRFEISIPRKVSLGDIDDAEALAKMFFRTVRRSIRKNANLPSKMATCCECGEDYPESDLEAGLIYCQKCRDEAILPDVPPDSPMDAA